MRPQYIIAFALSSLLCASCIRNSYGELKVINESSETIQVKYCSERTEGNCDTVILVIHSGTDAILKSFSSSIDARRFSCCPCETRIFSITRGNSNIKKDPDNPASWSIPNKKALKKPVKEAVKCELHITNDDL